MATDIAHYRQPIFRPTSIAASDSDQPTGVVRLRVPQTGSHLDRIRKWAKPSGQNGFKWIQVHVMRRIMPRITEIAPDRAGPKQLALLLDTLPPGRRRVATALITDDCGLTYRAVAAQLALSLGTVHQHLRRIRLRHPQVYAALMKERDRQLAVRHQQALERAQAHSDRWHQITKRRYSFRFRR